MGSQFDIWLEYLQYPTHTLSSMICFICLCSFYFRSIDLFRSIFDVRFIRFHPCRCFTHCCGVLCCSHTFRMSLSLDSIWFLSLCEMHKSFEFKLNEFGHIIIIIIKHAFFRLSAFGNSVCLTWCMYVLTLLISSFGLRKKILTTYYILYEHWALSIECVRQRHIISIIYIYVSSSFFVRGVNKSKI